MNKSLLADSPARFGQLFAQAMRPQMTTLPYAIYIAVLIWQHDLSPIKAIAGYIVTLCSYGVVVIMNDLADRRTDILNKRKDIPLAAGTLDTAQLTTFLIVLAVVGGVGGYFLNWMAMVWFVAYLSLGWLYSYGPALKNNGFLAPPLLGFCYGVMPWLLGTAATLHGWGIELFAVASASFVFSTATIPFKDFKDLIGDRATGKRTLLVMYGPKIVGWVTFVGIAAAFMLAAIGQGVTRIFLCALLACGLPWIALRHDLTESSRARARWLNSLRLFFFGFMIAGLIL